MTVENAHSFLDDLAKDGHSHDLMAKIGTEFNADHMTEALKQKGITREDMLKQASGGLSTGANLGISGGVAVGTAAGAAAAA